MALNTATDYQRSRGFAAQREHVKERLMLLGMGTKVAEEWLAAWEGSSNMAAERFSSDFWDRGGRWAVNAWTARQTPPTIEH